MILDQSSWVSGTYYCLKPPQGFSCFKRFQKHWIREIYWPGRKCSVIGIGWDSDMLANFICRLQMSCVDSNFLIFKTLTLTLVGYKFYKPKSFTCKKSKMINDRRNIGRPQCGKRGLWIFFLKETEKQNNKKKQKLVRTGYAETLYYLFLSPTLSDPS